MSDFENNRFVYKIGLIDIDIKYGMCVFRTYSAIGKTYLTKIVSKYDSDIGFITIGSKAEYVYFTKNGFMRDKNVVYIFDRFDMFATDELVEYIFSANDKCVLLDYKFTRLFGRFFKNVNFISSEIIDGGRLVVRDAIFRR